jgi:hypothetical protein
LAKKRYAGSNKITQGAWRRAQGVKVRVANLLFVIPAKAGIQIWIPVSTPAR